MRKLLLLLALVSLQATAQKLAVLPVPVFLQADSSQPEAQVVLVMSYGSATIDAVKGDTALVKTITAAEISVVCSDYPSAAPLDSLNRKRLESMFRLFPALRSIP